ncbi:MAG TPA: hypothetical protein VNQ76_07665 [Planctomicrobium sp.]|nr:hypothetical protein [Planctomicrobium sp.]
MINRLLEAEVPVVNVTVSLMAYHSDNLSTTNFSDERNLQELLETLRAES